jgi:hypothetical protein
MLARGQDWRRILLSNSLLQQDSKDKIMHNFLKVLVLFLSMSAASILAQQKDERGGDCAQTKSQYEYFCTKKGDPAKDDIMTTANIACNNAKRNMAAACDGKSEDDAAYKFDEKGTPATK